MPKPKSKPNREPQALIYKCGFSEIKFGDTFRDSTLSKGQNLLESKHVINVEEIVRPGKLPEIEGYCLPQTKINNAPYKLSISLNSDRSIVRFMCNCVAGAGALNKGGVIHACKHVAAMALYINKEREESS